MPNQSYSSIVTPSYPYNTGNWLKAQKAFEDSYDFRQVVTYRRYHLTTDNITGDFDWSSYTEYNIYADVQIAETANPLVEAGMLDVGDAVVFLPTRIEKNYLGTRIVEFRPQIQDEITLRGVTWKVDKLEIKTFGATETYLKCYCKRRKSVEPEVKWNDNYAGNKGFD